MKRGWIVGVVWALLVSGLLCGCSSLQDISKRATVPEPIVVARGSVADATEETTEPELQTEELPIETEPERIAVQAKGIYISAYVAGTPERLDEILKEMDRTEANTVVIDFKDDFGRVVCQTDSELIAEIGSTKKYIGDMEGLMQKLDQHGIYTIARIPAFRDAWLGDAKPEWCVQKADGTVFRDKDGNAWINPYKEEAWDYLVEIALQAKKMGFCEVQFDYLRFCTEKSMSEVVFLEEDTKGRSKTDIITEFVAYAYDKLKKEGLFVSADVYGAIINSEVNANAVGQIYGEIAKHLDYISPMIYPSHYGTGNYGIEHPDVAPYELICAALQDSKKELYFAGKDAEHIATVRPWLQDFTAKWLGEGNFIPYGGTEVRAQIQAVYDSGYDEWLLWDASCTYDWDGLLTPQQAQKEQERIAESRASLPETTFAEPATEESTEAVSESRSEDELSRMN